MTEQRPPIASAIVVHQHRVLMARRVVAEGTLLWVFPGGEVEAGETPEAAAEREVLEETGLHVKASRVLGDRIHPATGRSMVYVACRPDGNGTAGLVDTDELAEVAWCGLEDVAARVPAGIFGPVQEFLDRELAPVATER